MSNRSEAITGRGLLRLLAATSVILFRLRASIWHLDAASSPALRATLKVNYVRLDRSLDELAKRIIALGVMIPDELTLLVRMGGRPSARVARRGPGEPDEFDPTPRASHGPPASAYGDAAAGGRRGFPGHFGVRRTNASGLFGFAARASSPKREAGTGLSEPAMSACGFSATRVRSARPGSRRSSSRRVGDADDAAHGRPLDRWRAARLVFRGTKATGP